MSSCCTVNGGGTTNRFLLADLFFLFSRDQHGVSREKKEKQGKSKRELSYSVVIAQLKIC